MSIEDLKNIKLDKQYLNIVARKLLLNRRLIFILFFGILLVFIFDFVYKKAYIATSFVEYPVSNSSIMMGKEGITLNKITEDIEERKERIQDAKGRTFRDPFSFEEIVVAEENHSSTEENVKDTEEIEEIEDTEEGSALESEESDE